MILTLFVVLLLALPLDVKSLGYDRAASSRFDGISDSIHVLEVCEESIFEFLQQAFVHEPKVVVLRASSEEATRTCVKHYAPLKEDLSCLIPPPVAPTRKESTIASVSVGEDEILRWANKMVHAFREAGGNLTSTGNYVRDELNPRNLFTINSLNPAVCEVISKEEAVRRFRKDYWFKQRPVVIRDLSSAPSAEKLGHVLRGVGQEVVGCKLSDSADFEGVESLSHWLREGEHASDDLPEMVAQKLAALDSVVVRAAHEQLKVEEVLTLLAEKKATGSSMTAYVEYHRIRTSDSANKRLLIELLRPESSPTTGETMLEGFIEELFVREDGELKGHPYLWLGDGSTLGKRHFDPYDNLLFQTAGSKTFTLSPPASFSEGHLREGNLKAESTPRKRGNGTATYAVSRGSLVTSTSLVHTVDSSVGRPTMDCSVEAGSVLYVPSFWWHEVQSTPGHEIEVGNGATTSINMAVNMWFPPLFDKNFPCTDCEREFNFADYESVVQKFAQVDN